MLALGSLVQEALVYAKYIAATYGLDIGIITCGVRSAWGESLLMVVSGTSKQYLSDLLLTNQRRG